MLFNKDQKIFNYTVVFPIGVDESTEIYSVKDQIGKYRFIRLIDIEKLKETAFDNHKELVEIAIRKQLRHFNICNYLEDRELQHLGRTYIAIITEYVSSETLRTRFRRDNDFSVYDAKMIIKTVLKVLKYMHTMHDPIIHNAVTLDNILLNLSAPFDHCKLTGFNHSCFLSQPNDDLEIGQQNALLIAPERRKGVVSVQSDIYSVGIVFYQLLFGHLPWEYQDNPLAMEKQEDTLQNIQEQPLTFPIIDKFELDDHILKIISKATHPNPECRFTSAEEMLMAFDDHRIAQDSIIQKVETSVEEKQKHQYGNGFADVAGMDDVKALLYKSVINIMKNPERAKKYNISIPNGMLLYGPPGCGKSFFAEKFAEEVGCNYKYVKASDLASIYIHGSQEKIGNLFREAREKAPTILCFDEFDALVPRRDNPYSSPQAGEVNEFLSQLNNCGKDGVFIIATTNQPDLIDPAILRHGRIDHIVFLPPPDSTTRKAIFQLYLKKVPCESNIDFDKLAELTNNYVSSDIAYIVNETAILAYEDNVEISQTLLEEIISKSHPSLNHSILKYYKDMKMKLENGDDCKKIGFQVG